MQTQYDHTQPGTTIRVTIGGSAALCLVLSLLPFPPAAKMVLGITAFGMGLVCLLFHCLRVTVDRERVRLRFGVGLVRKDIRLDRVQSAEAVENRWIHGWGIHYTPDGWVYNVSGYGAVELTLKGDRRMRIGTDDSAKLQRAIQAALSADA